MNLTSVRVVVSNPIYNVGDRKQQINHARCFRPPTLYIAFELFCTQWIFFWPGAVVSGDSSQTICFGVSSLPIAVNTQQRILG